MVASNLFGDILSDEAAMLAGLIGLLPSASLGSLTNSAGRAKGFCEPTYGSASDITDKNMANPLAAILRSAMLLRHLLGLTEPADAIEKAVASALADGLRAGDIKVSRLGGWHC